MAYIYMNNYMHDDCEITEDISINNPNHKENCSDIEKMKIKIIHLELLLNVEKEKTKRLTLFLKHQKMLLDKYFILEDDET